MENVCAECRTWRRDRDWNHSKKYCFFKIMLADFQQQLRVPRKFKDEFKGEMLEEIHLRGPSGNIWTTKLVKNEQDLFLRHGWEIFAKDHGLKATDFLVFQYSAKSCFDVLIFDSTGCEREGCYYVERNNGNSSTGSKRCCSMRETATPHTNAAQCFSSSDDENKNHCKFTTEIIDVSVDVHRSEESSVKMEILIDDEEDDHRPFSDSDARSWLSRGDRIKYLVSSRRDISREEEIAALNKAKEQSSQVATRKKDKERLPSCLIVMKPSHVSHGFSLTIPKWFSDLYLPKESQGIKLRVAPGRKTWEVQFKRWKQQCSLSKGWAEFVLDNNLEVSDVCVMVLPAAVKSKTSTLLSVEKRKSTALAVNEKKKSVVLNVCIYRVVQDIVQLKVF